MRNAYSFHEGKLVQMLRTRLALTRKDLKDSFDSRAVVSGLSCGTLAHVHKRRHDLSSTCLLLIGTICYPHGFQHMIHCISSVCDTGALGIYFSRLYTLSLTPPRRYEVLLMVYSHCPTSRQIQINWHRTPWKSVL